MLRFSFFFLRGFYFFLVMCGLHSHNFFVLFVSFSFCCKGFSFSYAYVCGLWLHVGMGFILINKRIICPFGFFKNFNHVYALEEILSYTTNHYAYVDYNCMLCFIFFCPSYRCFLFFIEPQVCALQSHDKGGFASWEGGGGGYSRTN